MGRRRVVTSTLHSREEPTWSDPALVIGDDARAGFPIGCRVRVKACVQEPSEGWGPVTHESIGVVMQWPDDAIDKLYIEFPGQCIWVGFVGDLEVVEQAEAEVCHHAEGAAPEHASHARTQALLQEEEQWGVDDDDGALHLPITRPDGGLQLPIGQTWQALGTPSSRWTHGVGVLSPSAVSSCSAPAPGKGPVLATASTASSSAMWE